jgi:hypothetical protein
MSAPAPQSFPDYLFAEAMRLGAGNAQLGYARVGAAIGYGTRKVEMWCNGHGPAAKAAVQAGARAILERVPTPEAEVMPGAQAEGKS